MEDKRKSEQNENKFLALISLIKRESIEEIKEVLYKWSNLLNIKDQNGRTALHYCSEHSSVICAQLFLEKYPNLLSIQDNEGYTAMHLSVISGNQLMTRFLIEKSDTNLINQCDYERHTSIHWATVCGQLECLDLLLNSGAHSSRADIHGAYPLHYSAQMCNPYSGICIGDDPRIGLAVLNKLLQCPDADVDCLDSDGRTPLLWAASAEIRVSKINYSSGSVDSILALINAGANISAKDKDGLTALHCASSRGHIDCVETLLTLCGADVNKMDANGCPPLFYAVTLGHADCTRLLIESGADVNAQDFKGRTAAHCGAARGQFETIKILGQLGANLWLRNSRGDLPLHEAIKSGRKELVKWLLDQIPSAVNAINSYGRSCLHIAAINNNIEMCKILIDTGADVNTVMKAKGHFITPLDASLQKGYRGVAKYLLLHGALPASRISQNKSSVHRYPSGRPLDSFTAFENNSPIESYDEWKARSQSTDSALHSQSQFNATDNTRTQLPKLPTLVKNNTEEQHIQETSSSTSSSLLENTNHYKNIREFETPLNDKPSNLKQAIITNVYVTNTPICHSKRVPPLKKIKKRRKTIQENEDMKSLKTYTPTMSSSSSIINGEENVKVVMETRDDSSFKLNDSSNEIFVSKEGTDLKKTDNKSIENNIQNQRESQTIESQSVLKSISQKEDLIYEKQTEDIIENKDKEKEILNKEEKQSHTLISSQKEVKTIEKEESNDSKDKEKYRRKGSEKSIKSSDLSAKSVKSGNSQKSIQDNVRPKRSVSRRRSSVVSTKSDDKIIIKQKTSDKKIEKSEEMTDKKVETSPKSSAKVSEKNSEENSEDIEKQNRKISKARQQRAKQQFKDKLLEMGRNASQTNTLELKSEETNGINESNNKELIEENKRNEENEDIDSITYIKSDNESVKSVITSDVENSETKSEDIIQTEELKEDVNENVIQTNKVPLNENLEHNLSEDKEEDKYYDQWESDSEKTVIDSLSERISGEDINNNKCIEEKSERKLSEELSETNKSEFVSNETLNEISIAKSEDKSVVSTKSSDKIEVKQKTRDKKIEKSEKMTNKKVETSAKSSVKVSDKNSEENSDQKIEEYSIKNSKIESKKENNGENDIKISPKEKTISSNVKTVKKVGERKTSKPQSRETSKSSERSKASVNSSVNSEKSQRSTSIKSKDNKVIQKTAPNLETTKKQSERKPLNSKKTNYENKPQRKSSVVSVTKVKPKTEKKDQIIDKTKSQLENKSFLSASDMSLNKSSNERIVLNSNSLKNSISNQNISEMIDSEDKNIPNISSEESIFDSSLIVTDIEKSDSQMYSDIDKMFPKVETDSPLQQHIQRNSNSPIDELLDVCPEYCNNSHKPESRCCHKLHFRTVPLNLGKIEVSHIGSRVDSRRDYRYTDNVHNLSKDRVRRVRRIRPNSDGYKAIDPNIITQTVEKSLRKYQLERKLFEELHELKRFQIRSGRSNEILMVKRLVDKFRREVKAPGMTDFDANYTYKNYELYLYDQLRRLSTSNEGKVSHLTRSASHENIQLIRNSNESITQSSPELMQNSEGLDTNQKNISETHEIQRDNQRSSKNIVTENQSPNETTEEEVIAIVEKQTVLEMSESDPITDQKDLGNDRDKDILNHFDNEFGDIVSNSELIILEQNSCDQKVTQNSTHYQNSEVITQNFNITEEVSHIIIDSKEQPNHRSDQINKSERNSAKLNQKEEQTSVYNQSADHRNGSVERNPTLVYKIEMISEIHSNSILNEVLIEQNQKSLIKDSNLNKQTKVEKILKQNQSLESNESSGGTDITLSDAKSTYGSTNSTKNEKRSQTSRISARMSSKSIKSNQKRTKEKQTFKKECLKQVKDIEPLERAKNRKKFKRLKTNIPPKFEIKISTKNIKNRWKHIKEKEKKKVLIYSQHKQNELISGFILWYELNKGFRNKKNSIDSQIDRYIIENRSGLQRTKSDSYLNRYKIDSNSISFDKSIKL